MKEQLTSFDSSGKFRAETPEREVISDNKNPFSSILDQFP